MHLHPKAYAPATIPDGLHWSAVPDLPGVYFGDFGHRLCDPAEAPFVEILEDRDHMSAGGYRRKSLAELAA
jgi:hypothetical protein